MPSQDIIESQSCGAQEQSQGILIPLDLPEFEILCQEIQADGSIWVQVKAVTDRQRCPRCGSICVKVHDTRARVKKDRTLGTHGVWLIVLKRRFRCFTCQRPFTEADQACGCYKRSTKRLREHLALQAQKSPIAQIAHEAGVGPRFVQECFAASMEERLVRQGRSIDESSMLPTPRFLGIDEFAHRKGHHYDTILCDLEQRTVLEVSAGHKLEDVQKLLERLENPDEVEAVSMDMSASFRPAVQLCLPKAQIVVDHFHVIQHVMKAVKKIVSSWAHKKEGKPLLEGKQHLFLKAQEDLTEAQAQERREIGGELPLLEAAWQLKEALRTWYATSTVETAAAGLDAWIEQVQASECDPLRKTLSAFVKWRQEILAFFQFLPTRISNGFVEGKNNRTKALMRQAYGYRNRQHLRLRILLGNAL
ncbi:MAG TPA: ISL3 family transposase [Ktedonobacteraceae bacterium]|nr:ISL3 family transposase [Ktedonobacteraceae bacterium]